MSPMISLDPALSQWMFCSVVPYCHYGILGSTVSEWTLHPMETHSVHCSALDSIRPCNSVMTPWLQWVPKCQNSLYCSSRCKNVPHGFIRPCSVTMDVLFCGSIVSQWYPWFQGVRMDPPSHGDPQCSL